MIGRILHIVASSSPGVPQPAPLGLPDWAPWVLIVVGGVILVLWWAGGRNASGAGEAGAFGRLVRSARQRQTPATGDRIDPETREVVDTLLTRLDERAQRLESLLADAHRTIARLEAHAESPPAPPAPAERPQPTIPRAPREQPAPDPPMIEIPPADPICTRVYEMADAGDDAVAIARRLDEHVGKVQLILALRGH